MKRLIKYGIVVAVFVGAIVGFTIIKGAGKPLPIGLVSTQVPAVIPVNPNGDLCLTSAVYDPDTQQEFILGSMTTSGIDFTHASEEVKKSMLDSMNAAIIERHNAAVAEQIRIGGADAYAGPPMCKECDGSNCCDKVCPGTWWEGLWCQLTNCVNPSCNKRTTCCGGGCTPFCGTPCCGE